MQIFEPTSTIENHGFDGEANHPELSTQCVKSAKGDKVCDEHTKQPQKGWESEREGIQLCNGKCTTTRP